MTSEKFLEELYFTAFKEGYIDILREEVEVARNKYVNKTRAEIVEMAHTETLKKVSVSVQ